MWHLAQQKVAESFPQASQVLKAHSLHNAIPTNNLEKGG